MQETQPVKRPQPKELVIRVVSEAENAIMITIGSEGARAWAEKEGPMFGTLTRFDNGEYQLLVSVTYDLEEVVQWLRSYNDPC